MGDYYKYKKILVILMIVSCGFSIIKNIFKTNVKAADDVNSSILSGDYVVQTDNHYLTLMSMCKSWQDMYCMQILNLLNKEESRDNTINSVNTIYNYYIDKKITLYFYTNSNAAGLLYQVIPLSYITNANITISGYTWQDSYNFNNIPFLQFQKSSTYPAKYISPSNGNTYNDSVSGNTVIIAIPCIGLLSNLWAEVFKQAGIISSDSYEDLLSSLEETTELNYTQNYYTKQAVQNTYSYITNDSVDTISSTGITQPQVTEPDISDAFDSLSDLLTNDNATTKYFTFTLPNGSNHVFALSPDFLRTSLTRVGGGELVTIIETLWYIGLYGLMIFTGLKIIGALLSGDLDAVTGVLSPVNSVVNSSLEVTGAFRTAGGDESAFRIRKG